MQSEQPEQFDLENRVLRNSIGCRIELQMSRGRPIKGKLIGFDPTYAKLAVEEETESGLTRLTFVRFGYVSALTVVNPKNKT